MNMELMEAPVGKNINDYLLEEIFRKIFALFCSDKLLQFRHVCRLWKLLVDQWFTKSDSILSIQLSESEKMTCSRQIIFVPLPHVHVDIAFNNVFQLPPLSCQFIASAFPSVTRLVFCYSSDYSQIDLSQLVNVMPNLEDVTLYRIPVSKQLQKRILLSLNTLQSLERLCLANMHECTIPDEMTIFRKLKSFSLNCYDGDFASLMTQFGPNLGKLYLREICCPTTDLARFSEIAPELCANLTHFTLSSVRTDRKNREVKMIDLNTIRNIVNHLPSLQSLKLHFTDHDDVKLPFESIFQILASLTYLTELKLRYIDLPYANFENFLQGTLPQIQSLQKLYLKIFVCICDECQMKEPLKVVVKSIPRMFPNLSELKLEATTMNLNDISDLFTYHLRKCKRMTKFSLINFGLNERGVFQQQETTYQLES